MIGLLLTVGSLLASAVGVSWWRSPGARAARRSRRAVARLERLEQQVVDAATRPARALAKDARPYVEEQQRRRLEQTPVDALKDAGATHVRWSLLRDAGLSSLADVADAKPLKLMRLKGIGPKSVHKIQQAGRKLAEALQARPVPPPPPELDDRVTQAMVRRGLDVLHTREALGDVTGRLSATRRDLGQRADQASRESRPAGWAGRRVRGRDDGAVVAAADEITTDAEAALTGELGASARDRLEQLATLPPAPKEREELVRSYRERQPELVALFEDVLSGTGAGLPPAAEGSGARLPADIVAAVEGLALRTDALSATLRRYQDFGARYLVVQGRTILGDDMGLGKTIQSLAAAAHLHASGEGSRFLVVAPATVVLNWAREVRRHTHLVPHLLHGPDRDASLSAWLDGGGVAITSYSTARRLDLAATLATRDLPVDLLVADEAHYLKNPEASRTRTVAAVLERSRRACLMTGTPLENRLSEFRSLLGLVRPDLPQARADDDARDDTLVDPRRFQQEIAAAYLRRNQRDVLHELPERIDKEEWLEPGAGEREAYKEAVASGNIMAMRRVATIGDWSPGSGVGSAKLRHLDELLEEHRASGRKVLVFSFFLDVLAAIAERTDVVGSITGGVSMDERERLMDAFREADDGAVLLGQIRAAGVGLNLQAASVVVLMEPQWKPSTEEQAIARAHRMGQTEKVIVHKLLARDGVDERIMELLAGKQELFETYATPSAVKEASSSATEARLARVVVEAEQGRLAASSAETGAVPDGD